MRKRYEEKSKDIVTEFNRPTVGTPGIKKPSAGDTLPLASSLPSRLRFSLVGGGIIAEVPLSVEILIGRRSRTSDPSVMVDLESFGGHKSGVSRVHAMVGILRDKVIVQDLQSINGTFMGNERLLPLKKYPLPDGVQLSVGSLLMVITYLDD